MCYRLCVCVYNIYVCNKLFVYLYNMTMCLCLQYVYMLQTVYVCNMSVCYRLCVCVYNMSVCYRLCVCVYNMSVCYRLCVCVYNMSVCYRLHKLLEQEPSNEKIYFNLGMLSMDDHNFRAALEWFDRATKVDKNVLLNIYHVHYELTLTHNLYG